MYTIPKSNYLRRSVETGARKSVPVAAMTHYEQIMTRLKELGVSRYGLMKMESRYLPKVIHPGEHIGGVTYGVDDDGSAMLVATDWRVIYVDKKPMFVNVDEISYDVIGGISFRQAGIASSVTLHTRLRDYTLTTLNSKSADIFVHFIEQRCLEYGPINNRFNGPG